MNRRIDADICIVGSGPAGLSVANELSGSGLDVLVLERGGRRLDRRRHRQNLLEVVGHPVGRPERIRRFALGGAGWIWAGMSPELDEIDLEAVDWIEHSGWPFDLDHLLPYYDRARRSLGLPERDADRTDSVSRDLSLVPRRRSPLRFGNAVPDRLLLEAAVLRLDPRPGGAAIESLTVAPPQGDPFLVRSRVFVLAAGGIETPRLLLHSGIGTDRGLVGRFFADHPYVVLPLSGLVRSSSWPEILWDPPSPLGSLIASSCELRRSAGVPGAAAFLIANRPPVRGYERGVEAWRDLKWAIRRREPPSDVGATLVAAALGVPAALATYLSWKRGKHGFALRIALEPRPNPESRVTLSDRTDEFGVRLPRVDWRLHPDDGRTLERFVGALAGLDEPRGPLVAEMDGPWPRCATHGAHHMGTTRMHSDPTRGVVDADCRVHGVDNLFIAGSSVFPTYGYANPTLTIVALSMRLADHLRSMAT